MKISKCIFLNRMISIFGMFLFREGISERIKYKSYVPQISEHLQDLNSICCACSMNITNKICISPLGGINIIIKLNINIECALFDHMRRF